MILEKDFELTAQSDLSEEGRFQIHFTTEVLGEDILATTNLFASDAFEVYKANTDAFITIKGLAQGQEKTTATLYNILGMSIRSKKLHSTTQTQSISTLGLTRGIYVLQLKAGNAMFSKKMLIQ